MKTLYFALICLVTISNNAISSNTKHLSETQKEPIFERAEQRKLAEDDNYIIIYFNKQVEYSKFQNQNRQIISKIMVNNEVKDLDSQFTIPSNAGLEVYFEGAINSFEYFFSVEEDNNANFIFTVNFSHFNWSNFTNMHYLFKGCKGLKSIDLSNSDLSKVTDMRSAVKGCSSLESFTFPKNLQNVLSMEDIFYECSKLQSINLSNLDLSKITRMNNMFFGCSSLRSVTFPENLPNLKLIDRMFHSCTGLKSIDLSKFDLSKVTYMDEFFYGCTSLESVTFPENLQNVKAMKYMFKSCTSLKSIDLSNCNLTFVENMNCFFQDCISLESVKFPNSLQIGNPSDMFTRCSSLQSIDLSNIDLSKTTVMDSMFESCSKLESIIFPKSGSKNLKSIIALIRNCSSLTSIDLSMFTLSQSTSISNFNKDCDSLVAIDFPILDLNSFLMIYGQPTFNFKYLNLKGVSGESSDYVNFFSDLYNNYALTSLSVCVNDEEIIPLVRTVLSNQGMEFDLEFCCNYTESRLTKDPNYIIVNFNKECTYVNGFENNYRPNIFSIVLDEVEKGKNDQLDIKKGSKMIIHFTAPLTDFSNFFSSQYDTNVKNIILIDFSHFNLSLIDKFSSSFKGCVSLQSLYLPSFTVSSETEISNMIADCSSLVTLDISSFDLTNNEINKIFKNLGKLRYVNLINCLGETNDIYTFLNTFRDLSNSKKFICLTEDKFNDVDSYYKESNNGDSIENEIENCCNYDFDNLECRYLLVSFNNQSTYASGFQNSIRTNISKIILNGVKKSKYETLEIQAGSKMKIYFSPVPSNFNNFFNIKYDNNVVNIDSIDFSHIDLSKVTEMISLLQGCSSLESITFSKYTPIFLNSMEGTFSGCSAIKSIDLSNFILPYVSYPLFSGCDNLIAVDLPKILKLTTNPFMPSVFFVTLFLSSSSYYSPPATSQLKLKYMNLCSLSGLDLQKISGELFSFFMINVNINNFFICLNEEDYLTVKTTFNNNLKQSTGQGTKINITLERCCDFNLDTLECELSPTSIPFDSSNPTSDSGDNNYIVVYFNGKIDYSNFLNSYRTNVTKIVVNGKEVNIQDSFSIQSGTGFEIHFDEPVESLELFFDSITDENVVFISSIDFSHFDSSRLSNMNSIFSGCTDLVTVDFTNFNWSNVKDIGYMFYACVSLKSIDLSNFDISKITNMERTFQSCESLESVIFPESSPQNLENMDYLFYYCSSLASIDLSKFDLSKITDMYDMFHGCYSLESVTFPESLQNVEDMGSMFSECLSLKSIDLSKFDLSKVTTMRNMFESCELLESVTFPENLQNVEDMSSMFQGCSSLKSIDLSNSNLTNVINMNYIFQDCISLESVKFPNSFQNIQYTVNMFYKCSSLQSIDLSNFNLSKTTNMDNMFQSCSKLESVIFPKSGPQSLQSISSIINGCSSLTSIDFSMFKLLENTNINSFIAACDSLVTIDFPIFDLKTYQFSDNLGPIEGGLHLKYINLLGSNGTNENFTDFFKQLYNNYNLTSLSVCVDDEEIIKSAQSILSDENEVDMELEYCCNFPICKLIETTNIQSTSILDNIEPMTTTEFYINEPQTSFVDEIEPKSSSGLFYETKTTDYEDNAFKSTNIKENIELKSTTLDNIEQTTFNNDNGKIQSTSIDYNDYKSSSNIQKAEPKSTYYEDKDHIESKSSYIDYILDKSTFLEDIVTTSTNVAEEEPKIITTEGIETKESDTEELQPKSTNVEDTEVKDTDKEEVEPKSTIIEEKESKSTNLEDTQRESTNEETIESESTVEVNLELNSTTLEDVQAKTTNVVETKSTNVPDIEIKSTNEEHVQIESTNIEEVQLKTTNIADIGIKSTIIEEIKVETTITEEKEQISTNYNKKDEKESEEEEKETENERQSEENKEKKTEDEHQKEQEQKSEEIKEEFESHQETQKETDKTEEETKKEEESKKETESEKEDSSEKQQEKEIEKGSEKEKEAENIKEKEQEKEEQIKKELDKEEEEKTEKEAESEKEAEEKNIPKEEKEQKTETEKEKEKKNEKEKETKKETSKVVKTEIPTNIPTTVQPKTDKQEETDKKEDEENISTNITLSFRQINNFDQKDTSKIEFDLYTLTMEEELSKGFKIPIYVNLIHTNGTRVEEPTEAICTLNYDIKGNTASSLAYFRCSIENLEEIYYSFRYNYSDYIFGVPNDEIALDPILTKKSIKKNKIIDSSDESNLPPTFIIGTMIHENCKDNGVLTFLGNISKSINDQVVFTLPLLNLEGTSLYCNLNGTEGKMECKIDREIEGKTIEITQTIIKEGINEVLLLGSFMPEEQITCANAIYLESTEKSSITISFRQVSHFEKKSNGFSFYFISLLSKEYKKGYNLNLKMDVEIKRKYVKKNANCILEEDASPAAGALVQANFLCSVDLSPSEYSNTNFNTIRVSQANDKIGGISNLNEITENPYKTDLAIKEIKEKRAKKEYISEYADIVDYLEEKVEINPIFNIDYIKDADTCEYTGKFILVGAPTDNITEDVKFDLPLSYPNDILRCEMITSKKNDYIEIICKSLFGFKGVEYIIFEQRLITKKNKEIIIIPNKQIKLNKTINCIDYNSAKISLVKKRSTSGLFFLQVSKFAPLLNSFNFFLALTRRETKVPFKQNHQIPVKLKFPSKMLLRNLEEVLYGITAKCDINNELQTDYAAGYNCSNSDSFSGTPLSMEIEANKIEDIEGIPYSANPDKLNYNIDYSLLQNLKNIDNLPTAEIQNINADTCSENGIFNITAILNKSDNLKSNYSDVWIMFSVPETRGLCEITIKEKNMTMTCQNEENFYITQVFIERQAVQDSEGNEIFFIESFINPEQFACDISFNLITKTNGTNTEEPEENFKTGRFSFRRNNSGLSGGAIAAIVICSVVIIAVVITLVYLNKRNIKKNQVHGQTESTLSGFIAKGKQNYFNKN